MFISSWPLTATIVDTSLISHPKPAKIPILLERSTTETASHVMYSYTPCKMKGKQGPSQLFPFS